MDGLDTEFDSVQAEKLRALHDVTRELMTSETRGDVYETATVAANDILGFELSTIRKCDDEAGVLRPVAASPTLRDLAPERSGYERGESIQWVAYDEDRLLVFQDITTIDDDVYRPRDGSMLVVPLSDYGVLTLGTTTTDAIDEYDLELARVFGANLETALDRVDTLQTSRQREQRLQEHASRLNRLSGMIAHELRNPLTVARGRLGLVEPDEEARSHLDAVSSALERIERLTELLLSLANEEGTRGPAEAIEVGALAERTFEVMNTTGGTLHICSAVSVSGNPTRLQVLFERLFRYTISDTGGEVTMWIGPLTAGGFYVADDRSAVETVAVETLFAYRPVDGSNSTDPGLALVRDIADTHDWTVEVQTSRAGGLRIEFHT